MDPPVRSGTGDSAAFFGNDNALSRRPKVPHGTQRRHLRLILSPKGAVRHSKAALTAYSVAQRCRATLKGGTFGDFSSPESTATNYPVSKMRRSPHETTSEDPPVSRTCRLAHETTSEDPSVSRSRRSAHETSLADPFVSRTRYFAHETTSEDPPVSKSHCFAHETTLADPFVSITRRLAHEATSEDPFVSRTRRLAHETTLADPPVSRSRRLAHETTSADPSVSRTRRLAHETTSDSELSCAMGTLRGLYGNSTGALRALLDAAEVRPEPVRLIERLGAFRDGDLDG